MAQKKRTTREKNVEKRTLRCRIRVFCRRVLLTGGTVALLGVTGGGWWWWHSGQLEAFASDMQDRAYAATGDLGLRLEHIYLEGRHETPPGKIEATVAHPIGSPLLAISVSEVKANLEQLPSVRRAFVERAWPHTLHIRIVEREPVALWQDRGTLYLMDQDGMKIEKRQPGEYANLPVVVGEQAPLHMWKLFTMLAEEPALSRQIAAVVFVGERRWDVHFKNHVVVKLPEINPEARWQALARLEREEQILSKAIDTIDMRVDDRLFIGLRQGAGEQI